MYLFSFKYDGGCIVNLGDMTEEQSIDNKDSEAQHSINDLWEFISSDVPQVMQLHSIDNLLHILLNVSDTKIIAKYFQTY